jgi:hypothetical protein
LFWMAALTTQTCHIQGKNRRILSLVETPKNHQNGA